MALIFLGLGIVMWQSARLARDRALDTLLHTAGNELELSAANLTGYLSRHDYLPHLLATRESVQRFLSQPASASDTQALNRLLDRSRARADVSDIYLLDRRGTTIAASNWQRPDSFMGENYAFRGYYRQAIRGASGSFHGLGTQSGARGYYFSAPAWAAGRPTGASLDDKSLDDKSLDGNALDSPPPDGVMVIKILLDDVEREWQRLDAELMVTDINGVIFMASHPALRLTTLQPLSDNARLGLQATRRYLNTPLPWSNLHEEIRLDRHSRLVSLEGHRYLSLSRPLGSFNWSLHILKPLTPVIEAQWLGALGTGGLYLLIALGGGIGWQRQRLRRERERFAERERQTLARARDELEGHVASRTQELVTSNRQLSREIEERRRAEESLRQTRDELIQAARMAVLGQLAAGINHELNQPLTAIRAYADNARVLLARDRTEDATNNLTRISELIERMADISAQLRQFSRKSGETLTDVPAQQCFEYALRLFHSRFDEHGVQVIRHWEASETLVRADLVRLEQVLVNLVGNALHAMQEHTALDFRACLRLGIQRIGDSVTLSVADNGPGLSEASLEHLFEPFFTTKPAGQGLGLGLSISQRIIHDLGGRLEASNQPEGGAVFVIHLSAGGSLPHHRQLSEPSSHA